MQSQGVTDSQVALYLEEKDQTLEAAILSAIESSSLHHRENIDPNHLPSPHLVEIFGPHEVVVFDDDLAAACRKALTISPERCREVALKFSWRACTEQFLRIIEEAQKTA